ncbi:hypothetical protein MTR_1g074130 [Medicago truncatula]|uniref:Uncharacterized protein n=1 Tax=Medicago truncatula TaxID=3880 RepID=A0A072VLJ9_MEDTR|nr:hypothetical protein MTR_1g074130 [Medicago truncatula]
MDVVIWIREYIKCSSEKCLIYEYKGHTQIIGNSGADWTDSTIDRQSTYGYCLVKELQFEEAWPMTQICRGVRRTIWFNFEAKSYPNCKPMWFGLDRLVQFSPR